jgi:hypothetical protein
MRSWQWDRRVTALAAKLETVPSDVIRLDFDSFSEAEKQLFEKIWEIQREYGSSPPADVIEANKDLIFKASEVICWRVTQLFMFIVKELLQQDEIEEWYFKLHFYNFFEDLKECLANVRKWSEKDREEFLNDMKQNDMMNKVFRIPRSLSDQDSVKSEKSEKGECDDRA